MTNNISIVLGQLNFHVGNVEANIKKIKSSIKLAVTTFQADLIIFPELALTGYPPEDLLFHQGLKKQVQNALDEIMVLSESIGIIIGFPDIQDDVMYNAAGLFYKGECLLLHHKLYLPNYGVFDEPRYFTSGETPACITFKGCQLGILICEDIWVDSPIKALKQQGAELIITINASPFDYHKLVKRQHLLQQHATLNSLAIIYVQTVGGQDELVFDGGSMVVNPMGQIVHTAQFFAEALMPVKYDIVTRNFIPPYFQAQAMTSEAAVYHALVIGIKDYVHKNGFKGVTLGLSGGIDSALTLVLAVDALGADQVNAVMMPSQFTSKMSLDDAAKLAETVKVNYEIIPIDKIVAAFTTTLKPLFKDRPTDTTEENIQARCRGTLLMALSNKHNWLVLTTGNKSEMAVGYATLYGDMAGGFAVLKDVPKQLVYKLANYRNQFSPIIPERIITRAPSAELAPNQQDSDSLPSYDMLDEIIECYIEKDMDRDAIINHGFTPEIVDRILTLIDRSEYKRRQAPPGIRITPRSLSRDRRYPITSGFCHQTTRDEKH